MAAPHVAGVVAQLLQANPSLTPAQVEDVLEDTAHPFPLGGAYEPDPTNPTTPTSFDRGHGLVDAAAAVAMARVFPVGPAEPPACAKDDADVVDTAGDAYETIGHADGVPATSHPGTDVLESRLAWDPAGAVTFAARLLDVPDVDGRTTSVKVGFVHDGRFLTAHAQRTPAGETFELADGYPEVLPVSAVLTTDLTGSFDASRDVVSVTIGNAALRAAGLEPFAPDEYLQIARVLVTANGAGGLDFADASCPHRLGTGVVIPPITLAIGPDAPELPAGAASTPDVTARLAPGQRHEWNGGPDTSVYGCWCASDVLGPCCRYEDVFELDAPTGGARFEVTVTPDQPADYTITVRDADGDTIGEAASPIGPADDGVVTLVTAIERPGRYTVVVEAIDAVQANWAAAAALAAA